MDGLIQLDGVTCAYGSEPVLSDVSLSIGRQQFSGIVGPSGSGKTTLLKVLLGSIDPRRGRVRRIAGLRIGYVPQVETVDWNFPVTVAECVLMARTRGRMLPWPSREERRAMHDMLGRLGIGDLADRHIRELSGGQQQRVFVARALLGDPQLLLMDEPTSGVDARTRHEVLHLLEDLNNEGTAIVLTTHDLNGLASHLPHLVCLNTVVVDQGPPRQVLTASTLERTFGAPMQILEHAGMPIVLDHYSHIHGNVVALRKNAS
jgi:ABC-type Mn2+/Zn2+ transport system ATPase subunit